MLLEISGVREKLFSALKSPNKAVRREVIWAVSNVTAGTSDHIEHIVGILSISTDFFMRE